MKKPLNWIRAIAIIVGVYWIWSVTGGTGPGVVGLTDAVAAGTEAVPHIGDDKYPSMVLEASKKKPVLVDFYASWCRPCKMMSPVLEELANSYSSKVSILKLDVDKNKKDDELKIDSIPQLFLYVDGKVFRHYRGLTEKSVLEEGIKSALKQFETANPAGK